MYIKQLVSNVKRGVNCGLGQLNLVIGENASGKSSIVESIELLLRGESPSLGAVPAELMTLATTGSKELFVNGALSDGREIGFSISGSTARASKPKWTGVGIGSLLASEVTEVLAREPKRRREAFLKMVCSNVTDAEICKEIPEALRGEWGQIWNRAKAASESVADALVESINLIRADLRKFRAEAKVAPNYDGQAPSDEEFEALQARLAVMTEAATKHNLWQTEQADAARRMARIAEIDAELATLTPTGVAVSYYMRRATILARCTAVLTFLLHVAQTRKLPHIGCPVCTHKIDSAVLEELLQQATTRSNEAQSEAQHISTLATAANRDMQRRESLKNELEFISKALTASNAPEPQYDRAAHEALHFDYQLMVAKRSYANEAKVIMQRAAQAAAQADVLAGLEKISNRLVANLLEGSFAEFTAKASQSLPAGEKLFAQLFDGDRKVCRVGLARNGIETPWQGLSGAERARCLSALACGWAYGQTAPVKLVVIDDVWLGRDAIRDLCDGMSRVISQDNGVTQVVICVVDTYGYAPSGGWNIIHV